MILRVALGFYDHLKKSGEAETKQGKAKRQSKRVEAEEQKSAKARGGKECPKTEMDKK